MNPEWHDFIQRHMAGTISDEEELVLQAAMKTNVKLRALYLDYMNLDVSLEAAAGAAEMTRGLEPAAPPRPKQRPAPPAWRALAALAVVLLMATVWVLRLASTPKPRSVENNIVSVKDDLGATATTGSRFYRIVPHGLRPGSVAYTNRPHVWEASAGQKFPASLMNADVVQTLQTGLGRRNYALQITVTRPADLFVLMPRREPPPAWLTAGFTRTGEEISLVEIESPRGSRQPFDVWKRTVAQAGTITLGPASRFTDGRPVVMYGIAAKAL